MKFSPFSIKNHEFNSSLKGFNREEVRNFLEKISEWIGEVQSENEQLKKDLEHSTRQIEDFRKIEKNLHKALVDAQETAKNSLNEASKQSDKIIDNAKKEAETIIALAKHEAEDIRNQIKELKEEKKLFLSKIKAVIDTQSKLLNLDDKGEPQVPKEIEKPEEEETKKSDINIDRIVEKLI